MTLRLLFGVGCEKTQHVFPHSIHMHHRQSEHFKGSAADIHCQL